MNVESTPLLKSNNLPKYAFHTSILSRRRQRVRHFQFCVCAIILFSITTLLLTISTYAFRDIFAPEEDNSNNSMKNATEILNLMYVLPDSSRHRLILQDETEWNKALAAGKEALNLNEMSKEMPKLDKYMPSYRHQKLFPNSTKVRNITRFGFCEQEATKYLTKRRSNLTNTCATDRSNLTYKEYCVKNPLICNPTDEYRTLNGTCNNLRNPKEFGVAYTPFRRILPADYSDGVNAIRRSKSGKDLPSARTVSLIVHRPSYRQDTTFTVMFAVWGQFLDHDITATAVSTGSDGSPLLCCGTNSTIKHADCFPVLLDVNDPFYKYYNISCLEFVRSAAAPTCCLGPREQLNTVSAYIDGSMIYGTDVETSLNLRTFVNGTLLTYTTKDNRKLLPISKNFDGCNREEEAERGRYCFATGDQRANENLHLTSMHLLWLRQHNYVAGKLAEMNGHWNDEKIYQETKKILTAQIQHITYNEFLSNLIGIDLMEKHELLPKTDGYFNKYNDSLDASISNAFATAAFRFGHSLLPNLIKILGNDNASFEYVQMHKMLLDPFQLYDRTAIDKIIIGASNTHIERSDSYFSTELKQHLFERNGEQQNNSRVCGLDLVTLNIQRGRDHGLPGYTIWRERCGLFRPRTFEQLLGVIDDDSLNNINKIYSYPDDIDLYTGALSEKPLNGSMIGPTLTCIILDQFVRLKKGDRFWYENPFKPHAFTNYQLNEIRKTLLASIICKNSDDIPLIQRFAMKGTDDTNKIIKCDDIPQLNLSYWHDNQLRLPLINDNFKVAIIN